MFNGAHVVIYSNDAAADRNFFKNILKLPNVDVGDGWLIFALPPSEAAFHPHEKSQAHELYLMCEDIEDCIRSLTQSDVPTAEASDEGWGLLSSFKLPGGGSVGFYQPRQRRPGAL